jgi:DNA-binding transcriptional LysR family regulator
MAESTAETPRHARATNPTVEQARAFCSCASSGSYRGGAEVLGYQAHVAVIRLVQRFTQALGRGRLLAADPRGYVRLTPAGWEVLPVARRFVDAAEALREGHAGVRFSAYPSIAGQVVAACSDLLERNPPLILHQVSESSRGDGGRGLVRDVQGYALDIAIAPAGLGGIGVEEAPLYRWTLRVLLPEGNPLVSRTSVTPGELKDFEVAAAPIGHQSRQLLDSLCAREGQRIPIALESASQEVLRELVRASPFHAAVLPDDAFGARNPNLGPALTGVDGQPWGGVYSVYHRAIADPDDRHEVCVADIAETICARLEAQDAGFAR